MLNQNSSSATRSSYRIVDDAAVLIAQNDVGGLHRRHPGVHVAGNQIVHEGDFLTRVEMSMRASLLPLCRRLIGRTRFLRPSMIKVCAI